MKITLYAACISQDESAVPIVSTSHGDLLVQVGQYCREHWSGVSTGPPPGDLKTLIEAYFASSDESIKNLEFMSDLPQPYASAPALLAVLQDVAGTPKHGEPEPCGAEFNQDWESDMSERAINRLHELIDCARAVIAKASALIPVVPTFTAFCQEAGGQGTIHIVAVEADELEDAITAAKQQCIADWSSHPDDNRWNMETVHCLGVAAGDVEILHWHDQPE